MQRWGRSTVIRIAKSRSPIFFGCHPTLVARIARHRLDSAAPGRCGAGCFPNPRRAGPFQRQHIKRLCCGLPRTVERHSIRPPGSFGGRGRVGLGPGGPLFQSFCQNPKRHLGKYRLEFKGKRADAYKNVRRPLGTGSSLVSDDEVFEANLYKCHP